MRDPIRMLVAGVGLIGRAHIDRIVEDPGAMLAGLVDPNPAAASLAQELGVPYYPDLEAGIHGARANAVVIATPNTLHVPNGLAAVAAGLPMLLEKPLSQDVQSGRELVAAAKAAHVPILVGHHRRHSPLMARARAAVAAGELGRLAGVNALCLLRKPDQGYFDGPGSWRREPGGGVVLINLIHIIDDLRHLCGEISAVQALESSAARNFPVEDTAAVILQFRNGALGTLLISDSAASPWSWELTSGENKAYPQTEEACYLLAGTKGSLAVPNLEKWWHEGDGWWSPIHRERLGVAAEDPLTRQMRHFVQVVRREADPIVSGEEGLRTLEVTLGVKQAATTGGVVAFGP